MKDMTIAKWIGLIMKIILGGVCAVFLGSESLAFFGFIFPPEKWYLQYTGFGLTMGAFIVYLYLLLKDAETSLQKTIALLMMVAGLLGELATAGFGMMIEGWTKLGWQPTKSDYEFMILVIRIMMGFHGVSLVLYWFGDQIIELMGDADGDGVPNIVDSDYKPKQNKGSGFRFPWQKSVPIQNNAILGKLPQIRMDNFTPEQLMELAKHAQEIEARNKAGQGNGQHADPTKAAP